MMDSVATVPAPDTAAAASAAAPATPSVVKGGLPLSMLLWVDKECSSAHGALPDCFGDSYLCRFNPVFSGARRTALAFGARFEQAPDLLTRTYSIAPLFALEQILESGEIPYRGDVDSLRNLLARRPALKPDLRELRGFFSGHRMLHESAHLIADRMLRNQLAQWQPAEKHAGITNALRSLYGEAFANTVESLGCAFTANGTHRTLWEWNSYIHFPDPGHGLVRAALDAFGPVVLFELAMWVFVHLNIHAHTNTLGDVYLGECRRNVFDRLSLTPVQSQLAAALGPVMFGLNSGFRAATTPVYFRMVGDEDGLKAVRAVDLGSADEIEAIGLPRMISLLSRLFAGWVGAAPDMVMEAPAALSA